MEKLAVYQQFYPINFQLCFKWRWHEQYINLWCCVIWVRYFSVEVFIIILHDIINLVSKIPKTCTWTANLFYQFEYIQK